MAAVPLDPPPLPTSRAGRKLLLAALAFVLLASGLLLRVFGTDTHHADRSGIWWMGACVGRIPPMATDITLRRDLLDHFTTYTIAEKDLHAFFVDRFPEHAGTLDALAESSPVSSERVGQKVGPFDWVLTENTVSYTFCTSNGAASHFYHDRKTGRTYQESAYW